MPKYMGDLLMITNSEQIRSHSSSERESECRKECQSYCPSPRVTLELASATDTQMSCQETKVKRFGVLITLLMLLTVRDMLGSTG